MRFWTNRPLMILTAVLVLLGAMVVYFLRPAPRQASGEVARAAPTVADYHRHLDKLMDEIDRQ